MASGATATIEGAVGQRGHELDHGSQSPRGRDAWNSSLIERPQARREPMTRLVGADSVRGSGELAHRDLAHRRRYVTEQHFSLLGAVADGGDPDATELLDSAE